MRILEIKTDFSYTHKGYERREYLAGQQVETDDDEFATVAIAEGWAAPVNPPDMTVLSDPDAGSTPEAAQLGDSEPERTHQPAAKRASKAHAGAPENKAAD